MFVGAFGLPLEDLVGVAGLAGVDQKHALLELFQRLGTTRDRLDVDGLIRVEPDVIQTAERRRVLVLPADRLAEHLELDLAGLLGQERRAHDAVPEAVERGQQTNGQAAAGPHAGPRRNVADRRDLQRLVDLDQPHRLSDQLVLDLVERARFLGTRVADADRWLKSPVDRHIDVLIDRRAQDCAILPPAERRQISAAAGETNSVGSLGDDHRSVASRKLRRASAPTFANLTAGGRYSKTRPTRPSHRTITSQIELSIIERSPQCLVNMWSDSF